MRRRAPLAACAAAAVLVASLALVPATLRAQRALGPSDDATVVPKGMIRIGIQPTWGRSNERFSNGLDGRPKGTAERLAIDYDVDSVNAARFEPLRAIQGALQTLAGKTAIANSLGKLRVDYDYSTVVMPITLEFGVTRRLTLGAMIPYVKMRNEVSMIPNPGRNEGTMGINPSFKFAGARAQNLALYNQIGQAVTQLQNLLTTCAGSSDPSCSAINADRARAQALATSGAAVAAAVTSVYGTKTGEGSRYAPVEGGALQKDIAARLAALSGDFASFLGAPTGRTDWISLKPVGAPLMGYADLTTILTDTAFGIASDSLITFERPSIGDVELGAKFLLYDGLGARPPQRTDWRGVRMRLALGAVYRLGTAKIKSPDNFADYGSGDGSNDIEGRVFADLLLGRRFWTSFVGRYGVQGADQQYMRIYDTPNAPFPALYRRQYVSRALGNYWSAEVSPRLTLTDALMMSATYSVWQKAEDSYKGSFPVTNLSGQQTTLDASILDAGTARNEHRLVAGFTYSTMAGYYRGKSALPLEVSYMVGQSMRGYGNVNKTFTQAIGLRLYTRLWSTPENRPARGRR